MRQQSQRMRKPLKPLICSSKAKDRGEAADTHDAGAGSAEQPAEQNSFDAESQISCGPDAQSRFKSSDWPPETKEGVLFQCFEFQLNQLEHITYECVHV